MSTLPSGKPESTVRLNCNVARDRYERLRELAAELNVSISRLIRAAVTLMLDDPAVRRALAQLLLESAGPALKPSAAAATSDRSALGWDPVTRPWALRDTTWRASTCDDARVPRWHETAATPWLPEPTDEATSHFGDSS